ncbi:MAG: M3 family oligoendopeptidase [Chloroflexi bacterium]|nr:M3 family oligoendopeptidase [Chloroflexota bacterium]
MTATAPTDATQALDWLWEDYEPFFAALYEADLNAATLESWLGEWSAIASVAMEVLSRISVATTVDTTDEVAERRYNTYMEKVYPPLAMANNKLSEKLVRSELELDGFEIPLRNMRSDLEIFREENLPLQTEESKVSLEYDKLSGAQTVEWEGAEVTLAQLTPVQHDRDRERRERAWRLAMERRLTDRAAFNDLWRQFLTLRVQMAKNAGFSNYRDLRWKQYHRFDYTPDDAKAFCAAIEETVVPAAQRIFERKRAALGLETLKPWDTEVDPFGADPLKPFASVDDLIARTGAIFNHVDPVLGGYFETMANERLLDLDNRKGKAPGGYCTYFEVAKRPFIFMNSVGLHDDVQTMLHEGGHAFHAFASSDLPYFQQKNPPMEFCEVASMAMELLSAPYLSTEYGGFYNPAEASRARTEHLETILRFWPYMAVVDLFQHWVYENAEAAMDPAECDAQWSQIWDRFMRGIDYTGLDDIKATGWHRKLHIFHVPFYYVEYGLAQLGAVQVFGNAKRDQPSAVAKYRSALALGGTVGLPDLFAAAGVKFAFDAKTLGSAVELLEQTLSELAEA